MKTLCYYPTDPAVMEYAGFKKGFTNHDWCARHHVGDMASNGDIVPCDCPCHGRNVQGVLFGAGGVECVQATKTSGSQT